MGRIADGCQPLSADVVHDDFSNIADVVGGSGLECCKPGIGNDGERAAAIVGDGLAFDEAHFDEAIDSEREPTA